MIALNTGLRVVCTLALVCLLSRSALAQSVLNFPGRDLTRIAITNTTPYAADVKFTLYNSDGSPAAVAAFNPVSRRISSKGQLEVVPTEIFRAAEGRPDTWIQVTSLVSGLEGFYFAGDARNPFANGGEAIEPQTSQTVVYAPPTPAAPTTNALRLTNPSLQVANFNVTSFNQVGTAVAPAATFTLPPRGQMSLSVPARAVSARVTSDVGIVAASTSISGESSLLIPGQGPRSQALSLVAPYFKNTEKTISTLVLANPSGTDTEATLSFYANEGDQPNDPVRLTIRANGIARYSPASEGWILVESGTPVSGFVAVTAGNRRTTLPLQVAPTERMVFSRQLSSGLLDSTLSLVGGRERESFVTVTFSRNDGTTLARRELRLPPLFRRPLKMSELMLIPEASSEGYVTVQSTAPVFALELIERDGAAMAVSSPQDLSSTFRPGPVVGIPKIVDVGAFQGADGIRRVNIAGQNFDESATLLIAGRAVPMLPGEVNGRFTAELPELEPGFVNMKVRAGTLESKAFQLRIDPSEGTVFQRSGQAFFQKVEVLETGLDPNRTVLTPIRGARVEVWDPVLRQVVSVSETDEHGMFPLAVPDRTGLVVRVLSRLRSSDVRVLDNMSGGQLYAVNADLGIPSDIARFELIDTGRQAGAFNILDNVQRANALLALSDPQMTPPPLTINWSERNNEAVLARLTGGSVRSTFFNLATSTAYILGDRNTDSDEFDDSVILHEYAHLLASRFSRDDSPGGPHIMGDILDPRLAWSEGWANFFSAVVRGNPIYLDSKAPGVPSTRYDLEEDNPPTDRPGYWSEASVGGLLWDLQDENQDSADSGLFSFVAIWSAFTELRNVRYVYLPFFLESFLARNPGFADELRAMVIRRNIDFQPEVRPSVVNPFPRPIAVGESKSGAEVDSFSSKRTNLMFSSHFYSFTTATGGSASITLAIEGLGPGNNPNANDLDLYLYDANGKRLEAAERPFNGQPEMITGARINPGTYFIEVRSFYLRPETNTMVFNSGRYRLSLQLR